MNFYYNLKILLKVDGVVVMSVYAVKHLSALGWRRVVLIVVKRLIAVRKMKNHNQKRVRKITVTFND